MNFFRTLLIAALLGAAPATSTAGIAISITIAPPVLPVYVQPPCPIDGYLWTPGYWAYAPVGGYYWVPGTWVPAPQPGFLWTPGYWGFIGGHYGWHGGYWGPHVGFYGGVNYGFGYNGVGFFGGRWDGGHFLYNTAVMHVNTTIIHNTYNETVVNNVNTRASFNGPGGVTARPTPEQVQAEHEQHIAATAIQTEHEHSAAGNRANFASENHGRPALAAVARPVAAHAMAAAARPQQQAKPQQAARPAASPYRPAVAAPHENVRNAAAPRPASQPAARQERPAPAPQQHAVAPPHQAAPRPAARPAPAAHQAAARPAEHEEKKH